MNSPQNPYADLLGIKVLEVGKGIARVQAEVKVKAEHANHHGYTHGGFLYSVADFAFELASNSHGVDAVGLTTNMSFHRSSSIGAMLEAVAKETHLGRSVATYPLIPGSCPHEPLKIEALFCNTNECTRTES